MTDETVPSTDVEVYDPGEMGPPMSWAEREWPLAWMGAFLESLSRVPVVSTAARAAGIGREYAYEAAGRHPVFKAAWAEALANSVELIEHQAVRWATVGISSTTTRTRKDENGAVVEETTTTTREANPSLIMFILKRHKPEYRERYGLEHSGPGGGPIEMTVKEKLDEAVERFDAVVVRLADARAADGVPAVGSG